MTPHRTRARLSLWCLLLASALLLPGRASGQATAPAYREALSSWRAARERELKADDGWLTVVGLFWLSPGAHAVGSAQGSPVLLPAGAAPRLGTIGFDGTTATFTPEPGVPLQINGQPPRTMVLRPQPGPYDVVTAGTLTFFVIQRGSRVGVRVRDSASPARRAFKGLNWYPIQESFRVRGRYVAYDRPRSMMIPNVLGDLVPWISPGYVVFTVGGRELRLHPVLEEPNARELFFILRDGTTGHETYPGGRFLYADLPQNGEVVLDFNKAVSPPCAFTAFATCPLPPKENALPVRIEAGEMDPHAHGPGVCP